MTADRETDDVVRASLEDLDNAPAALPSISPEDPGQALETLRARFEEVVAEKDRLQQENDELKRGASTIVELDKLIAPSAKNAFRYMSCYSAAAFLLLLLDRGKLWGFDLDESVLDLLVGSTAVTVLGLVGMVLTGIFVGARRAGMRGAARPD